MSSVINHVRYCESTQEVLSVSWSYDTGTEVLSSFHVLDKPAGNVSPDQITDEVLISWLESQLPPGEEGIRECIRAEEQRALEAETTVSLPVHPGKSLGYSITSDEAF
jgi:hypothetical protein